MRDFKLIILGLYIYGILLRSKAIYTSLGIPAQYFDTVYYITASYIYTFLYIYGTIMPILQG